jgi:acyl-CoA oxidase
VGLVSHPHAFSNIGPKFGFNVVDNGYLGLDHVRIPRQNMLMGVASVGRDGSFKKGKQSFKIYYTMLAARAGIVGGGSSFLGRALTIAIRYALVRRQFEVSNASSTSSSPGSSNQEIQVLDYESLQMRLFEYLGVAYALNFAGEYLGQLVQDFLSDPSLSAELHASSSGLKVYTSTAVSAGMALMRLLYRYCSD